MWRAAVVAALFGIHPLHVESVAWISERKDVLSALFSLAAIYVYVSWTERKSIPRYLLLLALFACAVMSKAIAVTVPCVLLLLDYWPLQRVIEGERHISQLRVAVRLVAEKAPLFLISLGACGMTVWASHDAAALRDLDGLPLNYRAANAAVSYVSYLAKTVFPADLAAFYPHLHDTLPGAAVAMSMALLLAVTAWAVWSFRARPYLIVGWLWFLGVILPVSGLFQVGDQAMADRYTYFSLIGVFLGVVWWCGDWTAKRPQIERMAAAGALALIIVFGGVAWRQTALWRDTATLYEHALAVAPENGVTRQVLANAYLMEGDATRAAAHYERALEFYPKHAQWRALLGYAYQASGDLVRAREQYELALAIAPRNTEALTNLGLLLLEQRDYAGARACLEKVVAILPRHEGPRLNLAIAYALEGSTDAAAREFQRALEIDPESVRAHLNFGSFLIEHGRHAEALPHLEFAAKRDPGARHVLAEARLALLPTPANAQ